MFIYTELLYRPLFNLLILVYNTIPWHDLGLAILVLTIIIKLILYPLNRRAIIGQKTMQNIQPKLDELKEKYKDDREKLGVEMMELYKREKINPFSSCLPLLIQLPILIAVYQVFVHGLKGQSFEMLYSWVQNPGQLNTLAFGFLELTKRSIPLAVLAGAAQYWQTRMMTSRSAKAGSTAAIMNTQMMYVMPIVTIFVGSGFPAGLTLYWFLQTALTGLQQLITFRKQKNS